MWWSCTTCIKLPVRRVVAPWSMALSCGSWLTLRRPVIQGGFYAIGLSSGGVISDLNATWPWIGGGPALQGSPSSEVWLTCVMASTWHYLILVGAAWPGLSNLVEEQMHSTRGFVVAIFCTMGYDTLWWRMHGTLPHWHYDVDVGLPCWWNAMVCEKRSISQWPCETRWMDLFWHWSYFLNKNMWEWGRFGRLFHRFTSRSSPCCLPFVLSGGAFCVLFWALFGCLFPTAGSYVDVFWLVLAWTWPQLFRAMQHWSKKNSPSIMARASLSEIRYASHNSSPESKRHRAFTGK